LIREKSHYTILPLESRNKQSAQIPGFWIPMVKWCNGFDQRKIPYTILPLESRNKQSAQIPGFGIPMVKWCMGFFSDQYTFINVRRPAMESRESGCNRECKKWTIEE
jgi:hypothetical protein